MSAYFPSSPPALEWPSSEGEDLDPEDNFGDATDPTTAMVVFDASALGARSSRESSFPPVYTSAPKATAQFIRKPQPKIRGSGGSFQKWTTSPWAEAAEALVNRSGRPYTASFLRDTGELSTAPVRSVASGSGGLTPMMDRGEESEDDDTFDSEIEFGDPEPMANPSMRASLSNMSDFLPAFVDSTPSAKKVHFGNPDGSRLHETPWSAQAFPTSGAGIPPSGLSAPSQEGRTRTVSSQTKSSKLRTGGDQEALRVAPNKHHGGRRKTKPPRK